MPQLALARGPTRRLKQVDGVANSYTELQAQQQQLSPSHRRIEVGAACVQPPDRSGGNAGCK
eukprot:CAMPEP_0119089808 /NCGR_PEP_ID=MMETSP1178-20130426/150314_1 /TAXON_ID=33656 /ORGANISM="unid sp, Strain CCMP2000" /LENGTH=61 /DNA_ID=CAMNT_0007073187 /DNA_START=274 /DNA_END=459 /DNA_ORIENTATION=-